MLNCVEGEKQFGSAVILAGGKSSRMHYDKQLMEIQGTKLIHKTVSNLKKIFDDIIIISYDRKYYEDLDVRVYSDVVPGHGPLGGIYTGLCNTSSQYTYYIACDMPVINLEYITYMMKVLVKEKKEVCLTTINGMIEPFHAFYAKSVMEKAQEQMTKHENSIFALIQKTEAILISEEVATEYSKNRNMFTNLNTKSDMMNFLKNVN